MSDASELKKQLAIDKYALDDEWVEQPARYFYWAEKYADAVRNRDLKMKELEMVKAEVDRDIRSNPGKYGLAKVTEGAVSALLSLDESIRKLELELIDLKRDVNILSAAKDAFDQRRSALENEVRLWIALYYSDPYSKKGGEEKVRDEIRSKLRKKGGK